MHQRLCLVFVSLLTWACDGRDAGLVQLQRAALSDGQAHHGERERWHGWHRFRQPRRCDGDENARPVCGLSSYESGLHGAPASFVFFDPRARGVAYAVSGSSIWRSTDSGETWSPRGDAEANIISLAPDGTDEAALIATTSAGIKASNDAGASWSTLALSGLPIELLDRSVVQPQRVYATVDHGPLLMSMDEGEHWDTAGLSYPQRADTNGLSVDPRNALDVVAALQFYRADAPFLAPSGTIIRSRDAGVTWHTVYDANVLVHKLVRCATQPDLLLAGTSSGVARSLDDGETWSSIPIPTQTQGTHGLAVDPHDCDDFYALQANVGPLHTRDGGRSFSAPLVDGLQLITNGSFPGSLAIDPEDATHLILSTHGGFYSSHDSGEHWSVLPVMLWMNITALAVSPYKPSEVWLTSWGQGVWTRSSEAAEWQRIGIDRLPRDYVANVSVDPGSARVIIDADPPMFSEDGVTFRELPTYSTANSAVFHPSDPDIIYLASQLGGLYKSSDGGLSWKSSNGNLPVLDTRALAIDPAQPEQLFLATNGSGIYRSDDAGGSWRQLLDAPENASCLVLVAGSPSRLYACLSGVTASDDGGRTWTQLNRGLPSIAVQQLLHDPLSDTLYASTGRGVFALRAGDDVWQPLDEGCEGGTSGIALMEESGRRYLVMGAEHGVRRRAL